MAERQVLIIDDEEGVRTSTGLLLADEGYVATGAGGPEEALELLADRRFDIVLTDVRMPGRDGFDLLPDIIALQPEAIVLVMSAFGDVDAAVRAVKLGAYDFVSKPFQADELMLAIHKSWERAQLERENRRLKRELRSGRDGRVLVAASERMKDIHDLIDRASRYKTTVLITGECGSGKEVVARSIHEMSDRRDAPFIALNCGAIPETLIESELFGHARGAFTGADEAKPGVFREANGGSLFLDEIGELPPGMQVTLLRVLQEEEVRPVGEPKPSRVDVRIVAATSRDLEADVAAERFRADLFYRLNVVRIVVPPLRERPEDIPALVDQLLVGLGRRLGRAIRPASRALIDACRGYDWPGNVRELENSLERAVIFASGDEITPDLLPFMSRASHTRVGESRDGDASAAEQAMPSERARERREPEDLSIKRRTRALEADLIRKALAETGGNRTRAARILELSPRALQYKIREYGL